jgi:tetratricopeptide (TPR) repeat protein
VLSDAGDLSGAIVLLGETLDVCERVLGPDDLTTLTTRGNLAAALRAVGRVEEAAGLLERTLIESEQVLGADHPSTLAVRATLAGTLQSAGQMEEAIRVLESSLKLCWPLDRGGEKYRRLGDVTQQTLATHNRVQPH